MYEKHALKDINLKFGEGITGLIGHTGSGKSTLIQLLNGLSDPTSGSVYVDGVKITGNKHESAKAKFKVGLVMQYPEYQLFASTVFEDIAFGPGNMGLSGEEIKERVRDAANFASVDESLMDRSPFDISGGQKRRVALAGVMAMRPEFLVLDEPAAGLDPGGRKKILDGVERYNRESGTPVVIVSHSMEDMAKYCDRLIVMYQGEIISDGTPEEIFSDAEHLRNIGLDIPLITEVAEELRKTGVDIGKSVFTVDYAVRKIEEKLLSGKAGRTDQ